MFHFKWLGLLIFSSGSLLSQSSLGDKTNENGAKKTYACLEKVDNAPDILGKYQVLRNLQNQDEDLFYSCLIRNVDKLLPIVYTPGVGEVCQKYGRINGDRGLTLKINNKILEKFQDWKKQHTEVKAIVVTDGGRILGLGDLGANGMGIPVGKMAIYSALGGVHPKHCLPVTLDVGTNNEELLKDTTELYVGLKEKRETKEKYYQFVDKFMTTAVQVFGPRTLIQFEDFANENAFKFLHQYQDKYTMFNDDIQGTAAVALAGIVAAERASELKLKNSIVLFAGAGEAGIGIANLIVKAIMEESKIGAEEARKKIYLKRSDRLIKEGDSYKENDDRRLYRHPVPSGANISDLLEIIKWLKPNILIGVSSQKSLFNENVLKEMAKHNKHPIIFALSNPSHKSECTAEEAYKHTEGKVLFASGSPFPAVKVNGQLRHPRQCNNAYIFPGVALAVTATQMKTVPDEVFLIAAETLAKKCTQHEDLDQGSLFPKLDRLRDCSVEIATDIAKYAFKEKLSTVKDIPNKEDVRKFILEHQYTPQGLKDYVVELTCSH